MARPVYGITVLRYEDGRTAVIEGAIVDDGSFYVPEGAGVDTPESWELRHRMLIDALEVVKREATACVMQAVGEDEAKQEGRLDGPVECSVRGTPEGSHYLTMRKAEEE